jgi:hypothetical protein
MPNPSRMRIIKRVDFLLDVRKMDKRPDSSTLQHFAGVARVGII